MRIISWLVTLLILLAIAVFAIGNRESVTLSLWPFDIAITTPMALLAPALFFTGILLGGFFVWIGSLHYRFEICRLRRELDKVNDKLSAAQSRLSELSPPITQKPLLRHKLFSFICPQKETKS